MSSTLELIDEARTNVRREVETHVTDPHIAGAAIQGFERDLDHGVRVARLAAGCRQMSLEQGFSPSFADELASFILDEFSNDRAEDDQSDTSVVRAALSVRDYQQLEAATLGIIGETGREIATRAPDGEKNVGKPVVDSSDRT